MNDVDSCESDPPKTFESEISSKKVREWFSSNTNVNVKMNMTQL